PPPPPDDPPQPDPVTNLVGGDGDDLLFGSAADETLRGFGGADTLQAAAGVDTLFGGLGADLFDVRLVDGALDGTTDIVEDFNYVRGDQIGLAEALAGVAFDIIDDVVEARLDDLDTIISVNRGDGFVDVLRLKDVSFTLDDLSSYGIQAPKRAAAAFDESPFGFTNESNTVADPAITPDGRFVVFADKQNRDGLATDQPTFVEDDDGFRDGFNSTFDIFLTNTQTGVTQRVSTNANGEGLFRFDSQPAASTSPDVTPDGRFVVYASNGDPGLPEDGFFSEFDQGLTEGDVYIRDMFLGTAPELLSSVSGGVSVMVPVGISQATSSAQVLSISDDGNRIAFMSRAGDFIGEEGNFNFQRDIPLDPDDPDNPETRPFNIGDFNSGLDVYVFDRAADEYHLASGQVLFDDEISLDVIAGGGVPAPYFGAGAIDDPAPGEVFYKDPSIEISGDGGLVAFVSSAALTEQFLDDPSGITDVFVRDIDAEVTMLISGDDEGEAFGASLSSDGTRIAYAVDASNDGDDFRGEFIIRIADIDRATHTVTHLADIPTEAGRGYIHPQLSPDGDTIAFVSFEQGATDPGGDDATLLIRDIETGETIEQSYIGTTVGDFGYVGPGLPSYDLSNTGIAAREFVPGAGDTIVFTEFDFG
ncbi:MAG: hypothetical protein AAF360_11015, partial [Pseudomonadota bacterium]